MICSLMWIVYVSGVLFVRSESGYMQDPYIVSPETVQYGSDVNMTCYILSLVNFVSQISFIWSENDEQLINGRKYEMIPGTGSLGNTRYYTNTLTVRDTMKSDEGKRYMCQVDAVVVNGTGSYNTEEYLIGTTLSPSTTTTASEGEDVTIFLTWRVTDVVLDCWSPGGRLLATIQSISVYVWPIHRLKVKVSGLITSPDRKTVKLVICNVTHGDAGSYELTDIKRRVIHDAYSLVIAAPMSTKGANNETAVVASTTSDYTHDMTTNRVTESSQHHAAGSTTGMPHSTATSANAKQDVTAVVLYIIAGSSVLLLVLAVFIIAANGADKDQTTRSSTT